MIPDGRNAPRLNASHRLAKSRGRAAPEPLSADEIVALEAAQDRADAEADRVWGVRGQAPTRFETD